MEEVQQAIRALFTTGSKEADVWLRQWQSTQQAWDISDQLLRITLTADNEKFYAQCLYFAATTLNQKVVPLLRPTRRVIIHLISSVPPWRCCDGLSDAATPM